MAKKEILKNINLRIKSNSSLAIVGASGSGKTTLCNIIARFWDVNKGEVFIGGHNVKDLPLKAYYKISVWYFRRFIYSMTRLKTI